MSLFGRKNVYDRRRVLEEASQARARNKRRKAIALYRWVLVVEPNNPELHAKLGPLLAETGQRFDAWRSYQSTARAALREGRGDKALAAYRDAMRRLPREMQAWQSAAHLLAKQGETAEAINTLIEGSRQFRSQFLRPEAVHLLRRARTLEPWHFDAVFELARHLARLDQIEEARILLEGLAHRAGGVALRRVRGAQFWIERSLVSAWHWLISALRPAEEPEPSTASGGVVPLRARSQR